MNKEKQECWVIRWRQFARKQDALNTFLQHLDWNTDKKFIHDCVNYIHSQKPAAIQEKTTNEILHSASFKINKTEGEK
jgi:hypothetical protein